MLHQNKGINQEINIHDHRKQDVGRRQRKTQGDALSNTDDDYYGQNGGQLFQIGIKFKIFGQKHCNDLHLSLCFLPAIIEKYSKNM